MLKGINEKLISRHPHIYGDVKVTNATNVRERLGKRSTEGRSTVVERLVPMSLPAMVKAYRIQDKVRESRFDWDDVTQVSKT